MSSLFKRELLRRLKKKKSPGAIEIKPMTTWLLVVLSATVLSQVICPHNQTIDCNLVDTFWTRCRARIFFFHPGCCCCCCCCLDEKFLGFLLQSQISGPCFHYLWDLFNPTFKRREREEQARPVFDTFGFPAFHWLQFNWPINVPIKD